MITAETRDELIAEAACCLNTLNVALIESEYNGENIDCNEGEVLILAESIDVLSRYIPAGTVIDTITTTDAEATIDLTGLVLEDGMSGIITINVNGTVIVIATFSGDFAGFTLSQFIDMLIAELMAGGTGFTGTNSDPLIVITVPTTYGILPLGSIVSISVAPTYYLRHERTSPQATGFTPSGIQVPAYVNNPLSTAYGYLYVPLGNKLSQTAIVDYTGVVIGNTVTFPCVPGIDPSVLAIGNTIRLNSTTDQIDGTIVAPGYNAGTGVLTFQVTLITSASNQTWVLTSVDPCFGAINVFEWDNTILPNGGLTFLQTIYTPLAYCLNCFYDTGTDAVYIICGGLNNAGLGAGVMRIDCSSPFVVAAFSAVAPLPGIGKLMDNPVTGNMYFTADSFYKFAKVNKTLGVGGYDATSNLTTIDVDPVLFPILYYSSNYAKTVNPVTGVIYYAGYYGGTNYPDRVLQLNPTQVSLAVKDTPSTFFIFNDVTNPPNAPVYDMFYHSQTQRLYVARFLGARFLFQSYDISSGVPATILNTRIDHATPNVPLSPLGLFNSIINFQPLHNRILLMSDTVVFIYNPLTMLFETSYVIQPNFAENFSLTDDIVNNNFYGSSGQSNYISVLSQEQINIDFEGEFDGEVITTEIVQEAGAMCDINPNIAISNIKKACGCCEQAGSGAFVCDNLTGTQSGGAVVCSQVVTTDGWTADGAAFCNLGDSDLPYEVEYTSCFSASTFYKLTVIVTEYTSGFSSAEFQGNFIANVIGNGTTVYYLSATAGAGMLSFSPVGWSGCIQYTLETYLPGYQNEGGWEVDQTTGCFVHHAGTAVLQLNVANNIIAGKTYQVKVSRGVVGTLNLVIGGETHTYTDSGVDTFTFTATVSGECYFTTTIDSEVQICLLQTCTITEGSNPEETSLILGAGTPTTYIDANGNPVLIT